MKLEREVRPPRPDNEATWVAYEIFLLHPEDAHARRGFLIQLDRWRPVMIGAVRHWRELELHDAEDVVDEVITKICVQVLEHRWCAGPTTGKWFTFLYCKIREKLRPPDEPKKPEEKERQTRPRPEFIPLHRVASNEVDAIADRRTRTPAAIAESTDFVAWFLARVEPVLTPTQFRILVGRAGGYTYKEITKPLGISVGSARVLFSRVTPMLRGWLAAALSPDANPALIPPNPVRRHPMSADPAELWTIADLAAWLRITVVAARAMLRRRELPPDCVLKIGRRVRLVAAPLREWAMRRKSA